MNDSDNKFDDRDDLWELMGKAKKQAVSPLFSRNVLREIHLSRDSQEQTAKQPGVFAWLRNRWLPASVCTIAVVLLSVSTSRIFVTHKAPAPAIAQNTPQPEPAKPEDTEVVAHLDELVAYEENSIWLEDSSN